MIKAKKSLGQNFLNSPKIAKDIVTTSKVKVGDVVIEIGPGKGILTKELLKTGAKIIAFEKDARLKNFLEEKFKKEIKEKKLTIIFDDIFNLKKHKIKITKNFKVVANIPYYITGKLLKFLFEMRPLPKTITLLVQYEVAKRITNSKKESILSLSIKAFGDPKFIKKIPAKYFTPKPNVDSAILFISNISNKNFKNIDEKKFFLLIKKAFSKRRKLLKNNIPFNEKSWGECNIKTSSRAEDIPIEKWLCLTKTLKQHEK